MRDTRMAECILAYLERYSVSRAVFLAHNTHVAPQAWMQEEVPRAGDHLRAALGGDYQVVLGVMGRGPVADGLSQDLAAVHRPHLQGRLEGLLRRALGHDTTQLAWVDVRRPVSFGAGNGGSRRRDSLATSAWVLWTPRSAPTHDAGDVVRHFVYDVPIRPPLTRSADVHEALGDAP